MTLPNKKKTFCEGALGDRMSFLSFFIFGAVLTLTGPQRRLPAPPSLGRRAWVACAAQGRQWAEEAETTSPTPLPPQLAGRGSTCLPLPQEGSQVSFGGNATQLGSPCLQPRWATVLVVPVQPERGEAGPPTPRSYTEGPPPPKADLSIA